MKKQTLQTIIFVITAFIHGFFIKDILHMSTTFKNDIAPASCTYGKMIYKSGEGFRSNDGCNRCSCQNGQVMCTAMACAQ